ncbi:MAG TPA: HAMP domain-containing protein, partial [Thermodesulfobacteriota bacterium]|nr:HAMP domain-containing protein [Thermodesulfobacteriota bacterium]
SRQIETYDDLNYRLSSVRVSISKLEYLLDMFVVARRFEPTTVDMIKGDVDKLDENINEVLNEKNYGRILAANTKLAAGMSSIAADWQTIKTEVKRLNSTLPQDEIMLLHNAVDVNTVLVTEKTDRLLSIVSESRSALFARTKSQALQTVIGFVVLSILASLIFHKKVLAPINRARLTARRISSGDTHVRFSEDTLSSMGLLSTELNQMLDSLSEAQKLKDRRNEDLVADSRQLSMRMEALSRLFSAAGRSLSRNDFFNSAVKEAVLSGGADGSALYLMEGDALRLKASAGFDDNFVRDIATVAATELSADEGHGGPFSFSPDAPGAPTAYGLLFKGRGYGTIISAPVPYNNTTAGVLLAAFAPDKRPDPVFFEALGSSIGSFSGLLDLFQKEHGAKRFLERVMNQMPFGIAVFDKDGACLMLNVVLKKYLGADNRFNLVGEYTIFKDDVFDGAGILPSIRKSYEGFATEFIINYDPGLVKKYFFSGTPRRLRVKSFPLYDAGGEISNIVLLYEDLSEFAEEAVRSGER